MTSLHKHGVLYLIAWIYFGFDDPNTTPLVESELVVPETILVKKGKPKDISIGLTNGKTGVWIRSVELTGENAEDFEIVSGELVSNVLLRAEDAYNFTLDFVGEELTGSANLVITLRNDEVMEILKKYFFITIQVLVQM